jgi:hypothetical protein
MEETMTIQAGQKDQRQTVSKQAPAAATNLGRGPVDAPGKRHRQPLPQERIDKRMGEPRGKHMGHKGVKTGGRSGRG